MKKVTIISPCYNGEKYLDYYFSFLLAQEYENVQYFFVDDGSTDKTADISKKYVKKIRDLKNWEAHYMWQKNGGAAAAINCALRYADGDYLIIPDSDDVMYAGHVAKKVAFMEENPQFDIAYCILDVFNFEAFIRNDLTNKRMMNVIPDENMFMNMLNMKNILWTPIANIIRAKSFFENYPEKSIPVSPYGQNIQLQMPLLYQKNTCGYIPEVLGAYIEREDSHWHTRAKKTFSLPCHNLFTLFITLKKVRNIPQVFYIFYNYIIILNFIKSYFLLSYHYIKYKLLKFLSVFKIFLKKLFKFF